MRFPEKQIKFLSKEKLSQIGVLNYERREYFKLVICDIFRVRNEYFLVFSKIESGIAFSLCFYDIYYIEYEILL